jgi:site-specific DNA-methyltransferase (adenine-specific)
MNKQSEKTFLDFSNGAILLHGDCLELMRGIPDKSIDMILCDLPFGATENEWDTVIPFEPLWEQYKRIVKDNSAVVLFAQPPFDKLLACSNLKMFRYEWVWQKTKSSGFMNAKKMPLKSHENILVFYKKLPTYNPQGIIKNVSIKTGRSRKGNSRNYGNTGCGNPDYIQTVSNYPKDIITFSNPSNKGHLHPTQKPVALLEYLIKTYTNEGDVVLDNCMGSGSTGVACVNTNRNFIGIELDENYFKIAKERI